MFEKRCSYNCFSFKFHEMFSGLFNGLFNMQNRIIYLKKVYYYRNGNSNGNSN